LANSAPAVAGSTALPRRPLATGSAAAQAATAAASSSAAAARKATEAAIVFLARLEVV